MINNAKKVPNLFPHLRSKKTSQNIMLDVIIALTPAFLGSIYFFGFQSVLITFTAIITSVLVEYLWQKFHKKPITVGDLSAVVTAMLVSLNFPVTTPLWIVAFACVISIIVAKQFFGGIGSNFANPALVGRAIIMFLWPAKLASYVTTNHAGVDAVSSATVLNMVKSGKEITQFTKWDMFIGNIPGAIGETSVLLLLIGFGYLWYRKILNPWVTLTYILTVAAITFTMGPEGLFTGDFITHILSGGLMISACYMITDYASFAPRIRIVLAIIAGVITAGIRLWGVYPEGACFAILITNCLAGMIDRIIKSHVYGVDLKQKKA